MTHICSLPRELPRLIFSLLSLKDRKSIRLTCKSWRMICEDSKFTENEKFVLRSKPNPPKEVPCHPSYRFPQTSRTHWEFHGLSLMWFPCSLWTCCGDKIKFILIYSCTMDETTFVNIVHHCTSLMHFRIEKTSSFLFCSDTAPALDHLINQGVRREELISFEAYYHGRLMSRSIYEKILKIYPNICTFGQGYRSVLDHRYTQRYTLADNSVNPSGEWAFPPEDVNAPFWILPTMKFKEFKSMYNTKCKYAAHFLDFFSQQPELERLWLSVGFEGAVLPPTLCVLYHVLRSLPKLKELSCDGPISWNQSLLLSPAEFCQFLKHICGLEALALRTTVLSLDTSINYSLDLNESFKLTRLKKLYLGPLIQDTIVIEILDRCCSSLKFLGLDLRVTRDIAQKIFKIQTNLETLQVAHFQGLSKVDSRDNNSHSFSRLQNLKRLYLRKISNLNLSQLVSNFKAPYLEYINFPEYIFFFCSSTQPASTNKRTKIFERMLRKLSLQAPLLKIICFHAFIPMNVIKLIEDCKRLKKLKLIYVRQDKNFLKRWVQENYVDVERLFIECPSLCWLASGLHVYSYDHCSKKLMEYHDSVCTFKREYKEWCED